MLALDDRISAVRLAGLDAGARDMLFELNDDDLKRLAHSLTEAELATLSRYLTGLQPQPREKVLRAIAANPARMQVLAPDRVRIAVVASADQTAAVGMMLRPGGAFDANAILEDVQLVADGRVSPVLLWEKHPALIVAAALAALVLLLMLHRLLFARRRPRAVA
jgi:hypothetical protein